MGWFGRGRYDYATTPAVEECWHLDADWLKELTKFPGTDMPIRWGNKENPSATIRVYAIGEQTLAEGDTRAKGIGLVYTSTDPRAGESEEHAYGVPLEYTACNFGGFRPWFRCPGVVDEQCERRCRKLYLPPRGPVFACRECYDLGYTSSRTSGDELKQAEIRYRRAFAKADAENRRPHPNNMPLLPERPKGMHHDTFEELITEVRIAEAVWAGESRRQVNKLLERHGSDQRIPRFP